ncbi:unnamed protein product [Closterium sp. NIES-53]
MNIQHMLTQRGNSSGAASTLTTVKTSGVRRQRKVKNEPRAERRVQAAASGVTVSGSATPPPPDDIVSHLRNPTYQRDFQTLALYGPHGVGCQLTAQDALTLADGECLADTVVDFHNIDHYSLVIAMNLAGMVSGKLSETVEDNVQLVHYDSASLHTKKPEVMEGVKKMLLMLHTAQMPTADRKKAANSLDRAEITIMHPEEIPTQSNSVDCGIYVCMYLHALVSSGFNIIKRWMKFYGKKSHTYRRQLREEVSLHTTGDLVVRLFGEGVEVPLQPLPQLGEFGALVFPKEDEVRTDLARQSGMVTRMELGGYVVCAAVTSLARACGISEEQLLSGAAHELQTYGTPLLSLSTSHNQVDHAASMKTLASSIHATPCPLRWTGVSWCPRGRKWGVKMVCGPGMGQQIRLGAYNVEDDAAYAYAAAAYVIRRKDHIPHMKVLTDTEMAALDGCVRSDVRHLVKARLWWRWRQWRTAMAEVGIAPGTPFPLENGGSRSPPISIGDDEGEYPLTLKDDAADEEMQDPELG